MADRLAASARINEMIDIVDKTSLKCPSIGGGIKTHLWEQLV